MRSTSYRVGCILALGFGLNVASADVVTVNLTGHVVSVSDSSLGITVGQAVTASYSYDTLTPLSSDGYYHPATPPASISVSTGGQTFQTQSNWTYQISVVAPPAQPGPTGFDYHATAPSSQGNNLAFIDFNITDYSGQWPTSAGLLTVAPPLSSQNGALHSAIYVQTPSNSSFQVQLDSDTLAPSLTISPASSSFVAQQNFDAVVLLSSQIGITSLQASVGGTPIPLSYPGTCQLAPANNAGRTAVVCPNASAVLATLGGGPVTINWQATFSDGSAATQSVIWNLVQ